MVWVLAFFAGLLIGSFLNVCIYRLPRDLSVARPARSFCPGCEKTIAWHDNIPLLSYALLGGRCRHCHERIPLRYPIVELATGAAFALCFWAVHDPLMAVKYSIFGAIMIALIASDLEERILPDEFTLGGTALGLALAPFARIDPLFVRLVLPYTLDPRWLSLGEAALGAGLSSGLIWLCGWLYEKIRHREGLGFGDVKMIAMIGAFLGLKSALVTLMLGSLVGAVAGLAYIFATGKDASTYELPFGSFLGIAALLVAAGDVLVK
jgi:leader peptidase (prepilin peptidase) / N-methyltransferase